MSSAVAVARVLAVAEWRAIASAQAARADAATAGHRERALTGEAHAVEDFLFDYYGVRPGLLRRWHPGVGVGLEGATEHAGWKHYTTDAGVTSVDAAAFWEARGATVDYVMALLTATASRPAFRGCFGLHEWAMVYRAGNERRHPLPLRLGQEGTDAVVEAHDLACTHIDAFRFFTPPAAPRNAAQLTRADQVERDQPGCVHVTMDLYKWASKLSPAVASEIVMDAFELALAARVIDMRASPYDVAAFGLTPIAIETAEGKRDYAAAQAELTASAAPLRERLLAACVAIREAAGVGDSVSG